MDKRKIKKAVKMILEAVEEDPQREELRETPERVADFYEVIFTGFSQDPRLQLKFYSTKKGGIPAHSDECL